MTISAFLVFPGSFYFIFESFRRQVRGKPLKAMNFHLGFSYLKVRGTKDVGGFRARAPPASTSYRISQKSDSKFAYNNTFRPDSGLLALFHSFFEKGFDRFRFWKVSGGKIMFTNFDRLKQISRGFHRLCCHFSQTANVCKQ